MAQKRQATFLGSYNKNRLKYKYLTPNIADHLPVLHAMSHIHKSKHKNIL